MTLMGIVHNFAGLTAARFVLGLTESGLFPGIVSLRIRRFSRRSLTLVSQPFASHLHVNSASISQCGTRGVRPTFVSPSSSPRQSSLRRAHHSPSADSFAHVGQLLLEPSEVSYLQEDDEEARTHSHATGLLAYGISQMAGLGGRAGWVGLFIFFRSNLHSIAYFDLSYRLGCELLAPSQGSANPN